MEAVMGQKVTVRVQAVQTGDWAMAAEGRVWRGCRGPWGGAVGLRSHPKVKPAAESADGSDMGCERDTQDGPKPWPQQLERWKCRLLRLGPEVCPLDTHEAVGNESRI